MKLTELKGSYDAIFSLGDLCLGSIQLQNNGLRPYSGVLDWMGSPQLTDVNRLLMNRFAGFLELPNLRVVGEASERMLLVLDNVYQMLSNHDFPIDQNPNRQLVTYPQIKEKFDRRIQRFLDKVDNCRRILFVRTEGNFQDAYELQVVLSGLVRHDFRVLLINHAPVAGIVDLEWPLEKVCALEFPNQEKWEGNNHLWEFTLSGITHG